MRKMKTRFIGMRELRQNLSRLADYALKKNIHFVVLRHAVPVFHITPVTSKELELEELARDVAEGREAYKQGEYSTQEEMEKEL